jgi:hypothetical protein
MSKLNAYGISNAIQGVFPAPVVSKTAPSTRPSISLQLGQIWVNKSTGSVYCLSSFSAGLANWSTLSSGTGPVETINSLTPTAGNIVIAGTTLQLTATSAGSTVTLSLPAALTAPGSVTATTTLTATAGDITATLGNVVLNGAGKHLSVHGGAVTDFIGTATLASGTITVSNTNIATADKIFIQRQAVNGSTTLGELTYTISNATSFTITAAILGTPGSTQTGDTSIVSYFIVRQV